MRRVLAFELANRAYFAVSISDRGDDYFDHFPDIADTGGATGSGPGGRGWRLGVGGGWLGGEVPT